MCGIAVLIHPDLALRKSFEGAILNCISHRGPDEQSSYHHPRSPISFFHSRLRIKGTDKNQQPYILNQDQQSIVYNGELYNSAALAATRALDVDPEADTGVLLRGLLTEGTSFLSQAHGMWAFCWYDEVRDLITLSRDRYGIKPLYFGYCGDAFVVSSELKVVRTVATSPCSESIAAREAFFALGYVPAPLSIYEEIWKLPAGAVLELPLEAIEKRAIDRSYIDQFSDYIVSDLSSDSRVYSGTLQDAACELENLLLQSLEQRTEQSILPAHLLSGGCDSTLLLAMQQQRLGRSPEVYTAIFEDAAWSEGGTARETLKELGIVGEEVLVSADRVRSCFTELCMQMDEPFADSSLLACMVLCREVSKTHKIAFSGDGADELFHGYRRYEYVRRVRHYADVLPAYLRQLLIKILPYMSQQMLMRIAQLLSGEKRKTLKRSGIARAIRIFSATTNLEAYQQSIAVWQRSPFQRNAAIVMPGRDIESLSTLMKEFDLEYYLSDNLLVKMDRSSMAYGLEVRVPYLDHQIVDFAKSLPDSLIFDGYNGKLLIKELLKTYAPYYDASIMKKGFGVPLDSWLRGEFSDLSRECLTLLKPDLTREAKQHIDLFLNGDVPADQKLWTLITYQLWREQQSLPKEQNTSICRKSL